MHSLPELGPLLTAADFEPHVGKIFLVDAQPKPLQIRLEKIVQQPNDPAVPRQPFMLIFSSPWTELLLSAHYRMQPNGGGLFEIFLIPSQTAPGPRRFYHAVFN